MPKWHLFGVLVSHFKQKGMKDIGINLRIQTDPIRLSPTSLPKFMTHLAHLGGARKMH
jgi:hypothetical protein